MLYVVIGLVVVFLAVLLVRTFRFTPKENAEVFSEEIVLDNEKIIERLRILVRFKSVSYKDSH